MSVTAMPTLRFHYMLATGQIDFANHVFKVALMSSTAFEFYPGTHSTLSTITPLEIPTAYGYTQDERILTGVVVTQSFLEAAPQTTITWSDTVWTAVGGTIGPVGAAVIYDDSTTEKTVIGAWIPSAAVSALDGCTLTLFGPKVMV